MKITNNSAAPETEVPKGFWYVIIVVVATMGMFGFGSVLYANHVGQESNRKWCGVVSTLDDAYSVGQPTTPIGRKLAHELNQLRIDFDCPGNEAM